MNDRAHEDRPRRPGSLLSEGELGARRAAWRRRRKARRLVAATALAGVIAVLVIVATSDTGNKAPDSTARVSSAVPAHLNRRESRRSHATGKPSMSTAAEGRAIDSVLAFTPYVQLAGSRRREVALTFDDGPSSFTPQILRVLKRMHAPATFFVVGRSVRTYPRLVAAEARDGFDVGDHTEAHPPLALLAPSSQTAQLTAAASAIRDAGAPYPRLFRPPYGSFSQTTLGILHSLRLLMVLWSADTKDYARPGVARIIYVAVSGARPGAIILMHDGGGDRSETVAALPRIITRLRQRHFQLVTVSQLVGDDPPPRNQPPPHPLSGSI